MWGGFLCGHLNFEHAEPKYSFYLPDPAFYSKIPVVFYMLLRCGSWFDQRRVSCSFVLNVRKLWFLCHDKYLEKHKSPYLILPFAQYPFKRCPYLCRFSNIKNIHYCSGLTANPALHMQHLEIEPHKKDCQTCECVCVFLTHTHTRELLVAFPWRRIVHVCQNCRRKRTFKMASERPVEEWLLIYAPRSQSALISLAPAGGAAVIINHVPPSRQAFYLGASRPGWIMILAAKFGKDTFRRAANKDKNVYNWSSYSAV